MIGFAAIRLFSFPLQSARVLITALAALAFSVNTFAAGPVGDSPCVQSVAHALRDLLSLEGRRGQTHMPPLSEADRVRLIEEFKADGRPILVVTDAHYGQKSGVVTVMKVLKEQVEKLTDGKVTIHYVTPDQFKPQVKVKYQDLIFSYMSSSKFKQVLKDVNPQAVHVMVEGTLGKQARSYLIKNDIPFTTAYHTMFPEYIRDMIRKYIAGPISEKARKLMNADLRRFHRASEGIMVPTQSMAQNLIDGGYDPDQIRYWSHGTDPELFNPNKADPNLYAGLPRPINLFVGRVAVEKNIEDFLKMKIPGTKVIVGGGPEEEFLKKKYPDAVFMGRKDYEKELPKYYASADVLLFPSKTDTFGLVTLEANASGISTVAYNIQGPFDIYGVPALPGGVPGTKAGVLADIVPNDPAQTEKNFMQAYNKALTLSRIDARKFAEEHTWAQSSVEFMYFLRRLPPAKPKP